MKREGVVKRGRKKETLRKKKKESSIRENSGGGDGECHPFREWV